jgi:hypothetical protein
VKLLSKGFPSVIELVVLFIIPICTLLFIFEIASAKEIDNINEALMETTFKIFGPSRTTANKDSIGTMFLVGRPTKTQPKMMRIVMVTAAHVLEDIKGDDATIYLRIKQSDNSYIKSPFNIKIRKNAQPLYVRNESADIAVMYLSIPAELKLPILSTSLLAGDKEFEQYEMHPGDELMVLGYPLIAEANEAGFPILRSGKIASYPLYPANKIKTFLFDFNVFGGNSGGPVYAIYNGKTYGKSMHFDVTLQFIFGLVSQQATALPEFNNQSLSLAVVVPAQFIIETINMLPDLDETPK